MRLIFSFILNMFIFTTLSAQYLVVKGVQINGNPTTFVSKMKQKGFSSVPNAQIDGATLLKGTFSGYRDAYMQIEHGNGNVSQVAIAIEGGRWEEAKTIYHQLKDAYRTKYNVEPESEEFFKNADDETTGSAHFALSKGDAKYESTFKVEHGEISLIIHHLNVLEANQLWPGVGLGGCYVVMIYYVDNTNHKLQQKSDLEDL